LLDLAAFLTLLGGVQGLTIEQVKSLILRPPLLQQNNKKIVMKIGLLFAPPSIPLFFLL
jgi:hypothetical protein